MRKINFKKLFDNNKFLKVISILIGIIAWVVVSVIINPNTEQVIKDIPIQIDMQGSTASTLGLDVIEGQNQKTNIIVQGKRYKVGGLKHDDFIAKVIPNNVTTAGEYEFDVRVSKKNEDSDYEIKNVINNKIKVKFDVVISKTFPLEAEITGYKAEKGYIIEKATAVEKEIKVKGPKPYIDKISKLVIKSNGKDRQNLKESLIVNGELFVYEENGSQIDNKYLEFSTSNFDISIPIYVEKVLKLDIKFSNVPEGFDISKIKYSLSTKELNVAMSTDVSDKLNEFTVATIDFRKIDIGSVFTFDLALPPSILNRSDVNKLIVTFDSEGLSSTTLSTNNINLINILENYSNYKIEVKTKIINDIKIVGEKDIISSLTNSDIVANVDLSEIQVQNGQFKAPVKIIIPNKDLVWAIGEYSVIIEARPK